MYGSPVAMDTNVTMISDVCPAHPSCLRPALGALWTWQSVACCWRRAASYPLCFILPEV